MERIEPIIRQLGQHDPARAARYQRDAKEHFAKGLVATNREHAVDLYHVAWVRSGFKMVEAINNAGCIRYAQGNADDLRRAQQLFLKAREHWPNDPVVWFNLGATCERRGNIPGAVHAYKWCVMLGDTDGLGHQALQLLL